MIRPGGIGPGSVGVGVSCRGSMTLSLIDVATPAAAIPAKAGHRNDDGAGSLPDQGSHDAHAFACAWGPVYSAKRHSIAAAMAGSIST